MKAEVAKAVAEIQAYYAPLQIDILESPCGGAYVLIHDVPLGAPYAQATTWVAFFITNACPYADTYPFHVRPDLSRLDTQPLKLPIHINRNWAPNLPNISVRSAVMVSRKQNHAHCIGKESPLLKLQTVLKWMLAQ